MVGMVRLELISSMPWNRMTPNKSLFSPLMMRSVSTARA